MPNSITTTITYGITLTTPNSAFTITNTGGINVTGKALVTSNAASQVYVLNSGNITGGYGVYLGNDATLNNTGSVFGQTYGLEFYTDSASKATNSGYIGSAYIGAVLEDSPSTEYLGKVLLNSGRIYGKVSGVGIQYGQLTNTGQIISNTIGIAMAAGFATNSGDISGGRYGVLLSSTISNKPALLTNSGEISGAAAGAVIFEQDSITNTGLITGSTFGIAADGGTITTSGTIVGGKDAIYAARSDLFVNPGAMFDGNVVDNQGGLYLGGIFNGSLGGIGSALTGFSSVNFGNNNWTLSGNAAGLANNEMISGFGHGDEIILSGFLASSSTFVAETGLQLNGGGADKTLDFTNFYNGYRFTVTNAGGNATISLATAAPLPTIRKFWDSQVSLGTSDYAANLTVTNSGWIYNGAADAAVLDSSADTLTNEGIIGGNTAVLMADGGSLHNSGLIIGQNGAGIAVSADADIYNSGAITGSSDGITLADGGSVTNVTTITGQNGAGIASGSGGIINNAGVVTGSAFGISLANGGDISNIGIISGATDALYNKAGALTLSIDGGAIFAGSVNDAAGTGQLILTTDGGTFDLGSSFTGFNDISFSKYGWVLEGGAAALADGQTMTSFQTNDALLLNGFAAISDTATGTGLILSNGVSTETIGLVASSANNIFSLTTQGNATRINELTARVTGYQTSGVTPGNNGDALDFTVTSSGRINTASRAAIYDQPGIGLSGPGTLANFGVVASTADYGVLINTGAMFNNYGTVNGPTAVDSDGIVSNTGLIGSTLTKTGIFTNSDSASIINSGTVTGTYDGIASPNSGLVENSNLIIGSKDGVYLQYNLSLINAGTIIGGMAGVDDQRAGGGSGPVLNAGSINGQTYGVLLSLAPGLLNTGIITSNRTAVSAYGFSGPGIVNKGLISGTSYGVVTRYDRGQLTNAGTITGGVDAVYNRDGYFTLTVEPNAVFNGNVVNRSNFGYLDLAGTIAGSLNLGGSFTGFAAFNFAQGATWTLEGTSAELAHGQTITGFTAGDTITLSDFTPTTGTYITGTGLILANGTTAETLDVKGTIANGEIIANALCFARFTRIHTPRGKTQIEKLQPGDTILTTTGPEKIHWIGRRAYAGRFIAGNHLALPVTIKRHALAKNVPSRDLTVSPGHGLFIFGTLIPAWRLINGVTITQANAVDQIDYFHLELPTHSVILAENCPTESYLDTGDRALFQNPAPTHTPATTPLPRCEQGALLETIRTRLNLRAGLRTTPPATGPLRGYIDEATPHALRGWAQNLAAPDAPVSLDIFVNNHKHSTIIANQYRPDLRAAGLGNGCHGFALPGLPGTVEIRRTADATPLPRAPHATAA